MQNKIVIITGASAGLGKETAKDLLENNAKVIFACRNKQKTLSIINEITTEKNRPNAFYINLDLTNFQSVKNFSTEFSKKFNRLDLLINNAGQFTDKLEFTIDGVEKTLQTNHLSHFLLTGLMLKYLKLSEDPRIINVASRAHMRINDSLNAKRNYTKENYSPIKVYGISKASNIIFTENLKEYFSSKISLKNIKAASLHPGVVRTEFFNRFEGREILTKIISVLMLPFLYIFAKDEKMGAQTQLYLSHCEKEEFISGEYYSDCKLKKKNEIIRKYKLEENINELTYNSIKNSEVFKDIEKEGDEKEFMDYMKFFRTKF